MDAWFIAQTEACCLPIAVRSKIPQRKEKAMARIALSAALLVTLAATAEARDVYLNGVKLDSSITMKPTTFTGCDVRFDDRGDVYITAKGYQVTATPAPSAPAPAVPPPPPPPPPVPPPAPLPPSKPGPPTVDISKKGVWLVSRQTQRGIVQYDVDVFVNGGLIRKVKSVEDPVVVEITRWIRPGENRVRMVATKNVPEKRQSMSPTDTLDVILGEGTLGGATVNIERVLATFSRNAAETGQVTEDFSLFAK
jgi:hypothetical protein